MNCNNFTETKLSIFASPASYASKLVPMQEILRLTQYDNILRERTCQYRETMHAMGKKTANKHVKEKLVYAFSVAVTFKVLGHGSEQAQAWTGLAMCDIDKVENPAELEAAFTRLSQDPHVVMMYHTISGTGLRVIYSYQREKGQKIDDTSWRAAFLYGNEQLAHVAGHAFDTACSDYTRLSGMAYDPHVWFNPEAEPYVISDEMIVEENCEYQEHGKPRKTSAPGTFGAEVGEAWQRVQQMLSEKGLQWEPHGHHDYVMHAAYLFNRYGVDLDQLLEWASQEWADYDGAERERAIRHQYKATARHGTWKLGQIAKGRDTMLLTLPDICKWLSERVVVKYNLVTDQMIWRSKSSEQGWKVVDNIQYNTWRVDMAQETGKRVLPGDVKSAVESNFAQQFHPIREYIQQLPAWDGRDRVTELASYVHLVADPVYPSEQEARESFEWGLHKWLVGMVATWMNDQVGNQQILTLIGPQGIYKTTFFRHLLPLPLQAYFWENVQNSFHSKDDKIALTENCQVEIEEAEAIEGRDMSELKALVTSHYIKERRPYAVYRERKARLASFCATGNKQRILTDVTGSRRWLCYLISDIDSPYEWNIDLEQLYAQLYHDYQDGFQYYLSKEEERLLEKRNRYFQCISPEEELISSRLRKPRGNESCHLMSASMIAILLCGGVNRGLNTHKISEAMRKLKFNSRIKDGYEYFKVVEIPFDQQQSHIAYALENKDGENYYYKEALPF